jgi:hypothetical protein
VVSGLHGDVIWAKARREMAGVMPLLTLLIQRMDINDQGVGVV